MSSFAFWREQTTWTVAFRMIHGVPSSRTWSTSTMYVCILANGPNLFPSRPLVCSTSARSAYWQTSQGIKALRQLAGGNGALSWRFVTKIDVGCPPASAMFPTGAGVRVTCLWWLSTDKYWGASLFSDCASSPSPFLFQCATAIAVSGSA